MPAVHFLVKRCLPLLLVLELISAPASAAKPVSDTDPLAPVMAGEFALQAGQLEEAARWYLQAARAADDAGLAERATRIALLADADASATEALKLWKKSAPLSLAMHAAEATLSLRRNDARGARRELEALMRDEGDIGWRHALIALSSGG